MTDDLKEKVEAATAAGATPKRPMTQAQRLRHRQSSNTDNTVKIAVGSIVLFGVGAFVGSMLIGLKTGDEPGKLVADTQRTNEYLERISKKLDRQSELLVGMVAQTDIAPDDKPTNIAPPIVAPTPRPLPPPVPSQVGPLVGEASPLTTASSTNNHGYRYRVIKDANVRNGPSTDYRAITTVLRGSSVVVVGMDPETQWLKTIGTISDGPQGAFIGQWAAGQVGYISNKLLELE